MFFHHVGLASKMVFLFPMLFIQFIEIGSLCLLKFMSRWHPNSDATMKHSPGREWAQTLPGDRARQYNWLKQLLDWEPRDQRSELDCSPTCMFLDKPFNLSRYHLSRLGISRMNQSFLLAPKVEVTTLQTEYIFCTFLIHLVEETKHDFPTSWVLWEITSQCS